MRLTPPPTAGGTYTTAYKLRTTPCSHRHPFGHSRISHPFFRLFSISPIILPASSPLSSLSAPYRLPLCCDHRSVRPLTLTFVDSPCPSEAIRGLRAAHNIPNASVVRADNASLFAASNMTARLDEMSEGGAGIYANPITRPAYVIYGRSLIENDEVE